VRSFVALVPAPEVVDDLVGWQRGALGDRAGVRPLPAGSLHLTLAFLGDLDPAQVSAASELISALDPSPVALRLEPGVVGVPRGRPRVLALSDSGGDAAELQRHLAADLVAEGLLGPSDRPFWSHLSVARVRGGALDGRAGGAEIAGLPPPPGSALKGFDAVRVALYRSELRPEGASYSSLADIYLPRTRRMR
jgi:RNA 2',3'-cyclic 3'-phosphodiesterase